MAWATNAPPHVHTCLCGLVVQSWQETPNTKRHSVHAPKSSLSLVGQQQGLHVCKSCALCRRICGSKSSLLMNLTARNADAAQAVGQCCLCAPRSDVRTAAATYRA